MRYTIAASATAVALLAAPQGLATPLEDMMESCRHGSDLASKVAACTFVIERSHDRRTLLRAYNTRGLALCDLDRCAEAVVDFDHVVAIEPSIAGYFDNRARALRAANRLPEAIADSERAIRMAPTYAFTYMGKAYSLDAANQYDQALATADQALAIDPRNSGNLEFRGKMLAKLRRWNEAYAAFERALSLDPSDVSVYKTRAETEEAQGRLEDALRDYERYPKSGEDAEEVAQAMQALRARILAPNEGPPRDDLTKKIAQLEAEKQAAVKRADAAERAADAEKKRADDERHRADAEKKRSDTAEGKTRDGNSAPGAPSDRPLDQAEADRLNGSIFELEGQVTALRDVLRGLKRPEDAAAGDAQTVNVTVALISKQLAERQAELDGAQKRLDRYLETRPAERARYEKASRPERAFPRVAYATAATREAGELWIEPTLDQNGTLFYQFRLASALGQPAVARETIAVTPSELADAQVALTKMRGWSLKASETGIRMNYTKRVACFPQKDCPDEGSAIEGKPYTELRFIIRADGSTVARIQRGNGRTVVGYDLSTDSALLLGTYIGYAKKIAARDFKKPFDKRDLDKLFQ